MSSQLNLNWHLPCQSSANIQVNQYIYARIISVLAHNVCKKLKVHHESLILTLVLLKPDIYSFEGGV